MAKQKKPIRRVPHSVSPRTFGDGRPATTAQIGSEEATLSRSEGSAARSVPGGFRRRVSSGNESRVQLPLSQEYHYVLGDLGRLGILAGSMVILMVILGLILH